MPITLIRPERLSAWAGPSLLVVSAQGECGERDDLSGYYFRETRFVRSLCLRINGEAPWPCDVSAISHQELLFTFIYPELTDFGGGGSGQADDAERIDECGIPHRSQAIRVTCVVELHALRISMQVTNHSRRPVQYDVAWEIDADFADLEEANAGRRQQHAGVTQHSLVDGFELVYGHPDLPLRTAITCSAAASGSGRAESIRTSRSSAWSATRRWETRARSTCRCSIGQCCRPARSQTIRAL